MSELFKNIEKNISKSLKKKYILTEEDILKNELEMSNEEMIDLSALQLIDDILENKIENIIIEGNFDKIKLANEIAGHFVIALVSVSPVDYEGDEPLSISKMLDTTSFYILEDIKKGVKGSLYPIIISIN